MPVPEEINDALGGEFGIPMQETPCREPICCCIGCWCPCCASYYQREQLLEITGEEYVCCAGSCGCCGLDKPMPKVPCLCLETCCCTWMAITSNRFMVQTRFGKRNTPCDECIIMFAVCCSCCVTIASCFIDVPPEIEMLKDCIVHSVMGCMHAQQHHEIKEIKKVGYAKPDPGLVQMLPPAQQQMIHESKPMGPPPGQAMVVGQPVQQEMHDGEHHENRGKGNGKGRNNRH
eukprot:GEMP01058862.1.p1 GENE.GEMP01058862.1~~GEMP01058862.1.p1  ORF type:complete len:232 (+),score=38.90 GEMP01058862.1:259-954(+)